MSKKKIPEGNSEVFRLAIRSEYIRTVRNSSVLAYAELTEKLILFANADGDASLLNAIADGLETVRANLGLRAAKVMHRRGNV